MIVPCGCLSDDSRKQVVVQDMRSEFLANELTFALCGVLLIAFGSKSKCRPIEPLDARRSVKYLGYKANSRKRTSLTARVFISCHLSKRRRQLRIRCQPAQQKAPCHESSFKNTHRSSVRIRMRSPRRNLLGAGCFTSIAHPICLRSAI